jgi:hypothetical protein
MSARSSLTDRFTEIGSGAKLAYLFDGAPYVHVRFGYLALESLEFGGHGRMPTASMTKFASRK